MPDPPTAPPCCRLSPRPTPAKWNGSATRWPPIGSTTTRPVSADGRQPMGERRARIGCSRGVPAGRRPRARSLTDLIAPLVKRFPRRRGRRDAGRWMRSPGRTEMLDSATLWLYGNYMKPILRWVVEPSQSVGAAGRTDRPVANRRRQRSVLPGDADRPVTSARTWLPWLFAGAALLLAGGAGWWAGHPGAIPAWPRRPGARGNPASPPIRCPAGRCRGGIIELDAMARKRTAQDEMDAAVERYRVARGVLTGDGDLESPVKRWSRASGTWSARAEPSTCRRRPRAPRRGSPGGPREPPGRKVEGPGPPHATGPSGAETNSRVWDWTRMIVLGIVVISPSSGRSGRQRGTGSRASVMSSTR